MKVRLPTDVQVRNEKIGPAIKHSISIAGYKTSVSLEEAFWNGLRSIAASRQISVYKLAGEIYAGRGSANFSSAIRVLRHYREPERASGAPDKDSSA